METRTPKLSARTEYAATAVATALFSLIGALPWPALVLPQSSLLRSIGALEAEFQAPFAASRGSWRSYRGKIHSCPTDLRRKRSIFPLFCLVFLTLIRSEIWRLI